MRHETSLAIQIHDEQATMVAVGTGRERPYSIHWVDRFPVSGEPAARHRHQRREGGEWVVQTLPGARVQLIFMRVPELKATEMRRAVIGNILRDRGGRARDWAISHRNLPHRDDAGKTGGREVLAHCTNQSSVSEHLDHADRWGCDPETMLPDYEALAALFRAHAPEPSGMPWNLVYLGQKQRFLCIGDEHCLVMHRALPADLSAGEDPDAYLDQIAVEIERSNFFAQQTERSVRVGRVVVCGDEEPARELVAKLASGSAREVRYWDVAALFEAEQGTIDTDLFIPLAAAVSRFGKTRVNLLPRRSRVRVSRKVRRRGLLGIATMIAAAAPMLLVGGQLTADIQNDYLRRARAGLNLAEERARIAETAYRNHHSLLARETLIQRAVQDRPDLGAILLDMARITPREITYRELLMQARDDGNYRLELTGDSEAVTGVAAQQALLDFLAALGAHPQLSLTREPTHLRLTSHNDGDTELSRVFFNLECKLEWDASPTKTVARKE